MPIYAQNIYRPLEWAEKYLSIFDIPFTSHCIGQKPSTPMFGPWDLERNQDLRLRQLALSAPATIVPAQCIAVSDSTMHSLHSFSSLVLGPSRYELTPVLVGNLGMAQTKGCSTFRPTLRTVNVLVNNFKQASRHAVHSDSPEAIHSKLNHQSKHFLNGAFFAVATATICSSLLLSRAAFHGIELVQQLSLSNVSVGLEWLTPQPCDSKRWRHSKENIYLELLLVLIWGHGEGTATGLNPLDLLSKTTPQILTTTDRALQYHHWWR